MNFARRTVARGPTAIPRLPLVAFIDVILFLLLYFVFVADLTPEEQHLPSALRTEGPGQGTSSGLLPQVLWVESVGGRARYRMGDRVMESRASLDALLNGLPKAAGLVVKVQGDVSVEAAASALASGKQAGFSKISYVPAR
ncbi:MAG: hypothetical protein HBSAPP03_22150 [Phycisphaerae bacterium]|nr:MAG: hypothetical protein HBSAPP03_22150 [Phycisphaerae bacterium]